MASVSEKTHRHVPPRAVGFSLSSLGYAVASRFSAITANFELEPRDFALLRMIVASEGLSQQALAERMQLPASRIVALIDSLQDRGLIERRSRERDRRVRAIFLTDKGHERLRKASDAALEYERMLTQGLSVTQRAQLLEMLDQIGANLGIPAGVHSAQAEHLSRPPAHRS